MKNICISFAFCFFFIALIAGCSEPKKSITKLEDVKNANIGAMTGSTGVLHVKKRFPNANVKSFDDIMDAIVALKSNQLDAVITAYPTALNVTKHNPDLQFLPEPVAFENTAIAIRKGNDKLLSVLNDFITRLKNDGTLLDMKSRWLKSDLSPYQEVEFTLPTKGELLKVGTSATREPFCFLNTKKQVSGFDGELVHRISVKLNRPVEFVDMKFSALIPALQSGKVDLICAGMTATDERRKSVDFTESYFPNSQVLLVKKPTVEIQIAQSKSPNLRTLDDLKDKHIGVLLGSVHDTWALKHYPHAIILQYKNLPEILLALRTNKVDAAIYITESLQEMFRTTDEFQILGDTLFSVPIGIGFNKQKDDLREKFNLFFRKMKNDGTYDDMISRWLHNGSSEMPVIKNPKTNGPLVVGIVSDKGLPFAVVKNGKPVGLDIEVAERFAAYLGKELKLADMEFGSLLISAATNKIDMISCTLMITEERKKLINFSDEYLRTHASAFTLKRNMAGYNAAHENKNASGHKSFLTGIAESFYNNIIVENRYLLIIEGLKTTIIISILATILGTLLGGLICFMRMSRKRIFYLFAKFYISVLRGTPVLVVLMIIFYVVFASIDIDPLFVAVIAFGLNFAAYVSEMYRTGIEGVDKGQTEAGIAMGFSKIKTFLYIVMPQAVKRILPVYKGEVISLVKMTSIVGYIAVQDLTKASDIVRSRTFDAFFPLIMVAVLYFLIAWLLMLSLGHFERTAR